MFNHKQFTRDNQSEKSKEIKEKKKYTTQDKKKFKIKTSVE